MHGKVDVFNDAGRTILKTVDPKRLLISLAYLTVGAILAAFAVEEFLEPNALFDGGVTGVSMMLAHFTPLPLGAYVALVNLPFVVVAWRQLGKRFVLKFVYSIAVFSVFTMGFAPLREATEDIFLATLYGGLSLGVGVGLVMRGGGCLDGTEIVAILANRKAGVSVGSVILGINVVIFAVAGILFGLDRGMYSLAMYFVTSRLIDVVEMGPSETKAVLMMCDDGQALAQRIYDDLGRTVTFLRGRGLVSDAEKDVLYCVVTRAELFELKEIISECGGAFSTISEVSEIVGEHIKTV